MSRTMLALKALCWRPPQPKPEGPARLADPLGTRVTNALVVGQLWSDNSELGLVRSDRGRVSLSFLVPVGPHDNKEDARATAKDASSLITEVLRAEGCSRVFADIMWRDTGRRGWGVSISAQEARAL